MCRLSSSSSSHGGSIGPTRRAGARCGVPAPPYSAPGRARAAPARRHLPPRTPPGFLHHKNRLLARLGAADAALETRPDRGRRAASRGSRGLSRGGVHREAAGWECRAWLARAAGSSPGDPAAPAPLAHVDPPPHSLPIPTPHQPPPRSTYCCRRTHLSDAQSSTYNCLFD